MAKRILIPYMSAGLGHLVNAQAVAHYLHLLRPDWELRLMDVAEELDDELMRRAYQDLWKRVLVMPPSVSSFFFDLEMKAPTVFSSINRQLLRTSIPKARGLLVGYRPDAVVSTHWGCTHLFAAARGEMNVPIFNIHGEIGGVFALANCGADVYFALSEEAVAGLIRLGVPADCIQQIPFIVHPDMLGGRLPREEAKRRLGIPEERLTVLLSMGGEGMGPTIRFVDAFLQSGLDACLLVLAGRNEALLEEARSREGGGRVMAFGYLPDIGDLLSAADLLAGKCGTSFATLAVKRGLPLIITRIGAPNERDNMRYIVDRGYGWLCLHPQEFAERIEALVKEPATYAEALARLTTAEPGNGAEAIARTVVERLSSRLYEESYACATS